MIEKEKCLKQKLEAKRKIIKRKLQLLKRGEIMREGVFSPITKRLENIQSELRNNNNKDNYKTDIKIENIPLIKDENKVKIPINDDLEIYTDEPVASNDLDISGIKRSILEHVEDDDTSIENTHEKQRNLNEESMLEYLDQYNTLPRKYIYGMHHYANEFDRKYGVRLDTTTERFYIGDSEVKIEGSDIIVRNKKYKGTVGLYELLFKKRPVNFTETDEKNYQQIVLNTNAHRRYYQANKQIQGCNMDKYRNIIAPITQGEGLRMKVNDKQPDYIYWDDPNELVDRLYLMHASKGAGHTGHSNEINSILEELREAKIIY